MHRIWTILGAIVQSNETIVAQSGSTGGLPDSTIVGVLVSFVSAILVYSARQVWEKRKLRRALLTEIKQMEGIGDCADQMNRIDEPPGRQLQPNDVPAANSIPTVVYEMSANRIGLLGGVLNTIRGRPELENAVEFYSRVLRYKAIVNSISNDEEVSNTDQEDLYDEIQGLSEWRQRIIDNSAFVD